MADKLDKNRKMLAAFICAMSWDLGGNERAKIFETYLNDQVLESYS